MPDLSGLFVSRIASADCLQRFDISPNPTPPPPQQKKPTLTVGAELAPERFRHLLAAQRLRAEDERLGHAARDGGVQQHGVGLSLTPGGCQNGYMDHTGCVINPCFFTIRPTRVVTPGGCQIGYMDHTGCYTDHTGCHQSVFFYRTPLLGLPLPGIRLVTWTILAVIS
jgi:hypothetical protein